MHQSRRLKFNNIITCLMVTAGNTKGGSITVPLTSCLTGLESAVWQQTIFVFIFKNRLIQTSQTGGQWHSDTSPFSIPWLQISAIFMQSKRFWSWTRQNSTKFHKKTKVFVMKNSFKICQILSNVWTKIGLDFVHFARTWNEDTGTFVLKKPLFHLTWTYLTNVLVTV
jgi:hypothetical protein